MTTRKIAKTSETRRSGFERFLDAGPFGWLIVFIGLFAASAGVFVILASEIYADDSLLASLFNPENRPELIDVVLGLPLAFAGALIAILLALASLKIARSQERSAQRQATLSEEQQALSEKQAGLEARMRHAAAKNEAFSVQKARFATSLEYAEDTLEAVNEMIETILIGRRRLEDMHDRIENAIRDADQLPFDTDHEFEWRSDEEISADPAVKAARAIHQKELRAIRKQEHQAIKRLIEVMARNPDAEARDAAIALHLSGILKAIEKSLDEYRVVGRFYADNGHDEDHSASPFSALRIRETEGYDALRGLAALVTISEATGRATSVTRIWDDVERGPEPNLSLWISGLGMSLFSCVFEDIDDLADILDMTSMGLELPRSQVIVPASLEAVEGEATAALTKEIVSRRCNTRTRIVVAGPLLCSALKGADPFEMAKQCGERAEKALMGEVWELLDPEKKELEAFTQDLKKEILRRMPLCQPIFQPGARELHGGAIEHLEHPSPDPDDANVTTKMLWRNGPVALPTEVEEAA